MRRRRARELPPLPRRPYRDSLILHLVLGAAIVVVSWFTGGDLARATAVAAGFVVLATAWSWWRFRRRIQREGGR